MSSVLKGKVKVLCTKGKLKREETQIKQNPVLICCRHKDDDGREHGILISALHSFLSFASVPWK